MNQIDPKTISRIRVYLFDRLIIGYCLLMAVLVAAVGRPVEFYYDEIIFYCAMAGIAALIVRYVDEEKSRLHKLVRLLYPGTMFTFFYRKTEGTIFLLFDRFLDPGLTNFERAIFGVNPTIFIDQHLLNVWLNEIFSFCYFAYYFMIIVFLLILFYRKNYDVIKSSLGAMCLTFFSSYLLFFLYPIEGPRWHFGNAYVNQIEGPVFRRLVEFVIAKGAVHGGCMPSSHFGIALVILMYTYRYYRRAAWVLAPLVAGLAVGTVWGRFHYVSDVVVGGLIGLISVFFVWKYCTISPDSGYNASKSKEMKTENVS
ncbi:MAG: phosphatase PAP2 family protein [Candidatus Zixiibacteriota bacterium]